MVNEDLCDVRQALNLLRRLSATVGDELSYLSDDVGDIGQRGIEIGAAAVEHAGECREPILELNDLLATVAESGDKGLKVLDHGDDVGTTRGQDASDSGQLGKRLSQSLRVAVTKRVGGTFDESPRRCGGCIARRSQFGGQSGQLILDLVPLDGDGGAIEGYRGSVGQDRSRVAI